MVICWDKVAAVVAGLRGTTDVTAIVAVDLTRALPWRARLALRLPLAKARDARAAMTGPAPADTLRWEHLVASAAQLDPGYPEPQPGDVALLQYTGGTTGTPKGAMLTHRNLRATAAQGRAWTPGLKDGQGTVSAVLPLFHAYGLTVCLTYPISVAATLVLFPRFDIDQTLAAMRRRPATFLPAVPTVYERLVAAAAQRGADLRSIRDAISGAMALAPAVVTRWEAVTGPLLVEGYGTTETSPVALGTRPRLAAGPERWGAVPVHPDPHRRPRRPTARPSHRGCRRAADPRSAGVRRLLEPPAGDGRRSAAGRLAANRRHRRRGRGRRRAHRRLCAVATTSEKRLSWPSCRPPGSASTPTASGLTPASGSPGTGFPRRVVVVDAIPHSQVG